MTIEHSIITDPNIHEPKGVAAASSGKVYVANGAGSGTWALANPKGSDTAVIRTSPISDGAGGLEWKHNPGSVHGEIYLAAASVSVGPTGGTITTDTDYRVVGPTWTLNPDTYLTQLHASNSGLQVLVKGHYLISAYISFLSGAVASGTDYALKYRINNVATLSTRRIVTEKVTAGADRITLSASALVMLNANDYIELMLGSSTADTVTVSDASITAILLHEVV